MNSGDQSLQTGAVDPGGAGSTAGESKTFIGAAVQAELKAGTSFKVVARLLRHAAITLDPEAPASAIDVAIVFLARVAQVYDDLDHAASALPQDPTERENLRRRAMDNLATALDWIEDELAHYIADLMKRQVAAGGLSAVADAVAGMEPDTSIYDGRAVA